MIAEYKSKPQTVQAAQWNGDQEILKDLLEWCGDKLEQNTRNLLWLDEGNDHEDVTVGIGDWIVKRGKHFTKFSDEAFNELYGK